MKQQQMTQKDKKKDKKKAENERLEYDNHDRVNGLDDSESSAGCSEAC